MKSVLVALVLFGSFFQCSPTSAHETPAKTVYVSGFAEESVTPDIVVWFVTVNTQDKDLQKAKSENDRRYATVLKSAKRIADNNNDIESGPVRIDRNYNHYDGGGRREFSHYSVYRVVKIKQTDLDDFEGSLNYLINSTEVEIRFQFEVSQEESIRDRLRLAALDQAKIKAGSMVEQLGGKLGPVLHISEYPKSGDSLRRALSMPAGSSMHIDLGSPEARDISATVFITFGIE